MDPPRQPPDREPQDPEPASANGASDGGSVDPQARRRQRGSVSSLLIMSFALFMITNRNSESEATRLQYLDAMISMEHQLSNFSAWINGTESNFTLVCERIIQTFVKHYNQSWISAIYT
jgi:hypothetical protein